ncbi:hypothetical protein LEP1GSC005_0651 [Leptospira santarosai str. ST188]|nr:hypothetical protein LEP1GSC005_0651 [Leptospira santarosai str. ST188]
MQHGEGKSYRVSKESAFLFRKELEKKIQKGNQSRSQAIPIRTTSESTISSVKSFRRMRNG